MIIIYPDIHLNYQFVPMAVIILGSYAIASTFFSVYSMAVDTIFLCFLQVDIKSAQYLLLK